LKKWYPGFPSLDVIGVANSDLCRNYHHCRYMAPGKLLIFNGILCNTSMAGCVAFEVRKPHFQSILLLLRTEVWLGKPYNAACDVYSFTLLLWQMLALRQPFSKIVGEEAFVEKVVKNNARPPLKKTWRATLKTVISDCWSQDMKDRMTMAQVRQQLQDELLRLRQGDDSGLDHQLRRSTHIFDSPAAHQKSMREMGIMDLSFHSDIDSSPS
jgi:hypothetical protein